MELGRRQDPAGSSQGRLAGGPAVRREIRSQGIAADTVRLARDDFEFGSPAFAARIAATEFNQDPIVATNKKVVATLAFSHPVDRRVSRNAYACGCSTA